MNRGHATTATVRENVLLLEHNFVTEICCMKFTLFGFVRHETGTKWPPLQTVSATTDFYASIYYVCSSLPSILATYVL